MSGCSSVAQFALNFTFVLAQTHARCFSLIKGAGTDSRGVGEVVRCSLGAEGGGTAPQSGSDGLFLERPLSWSLCFCSWVFMPTTHCGTCWKRSFLSQIILLSPGLIQGQHQAAAGLIWLLINGRWTEEERTLISLWLREMVYDVIILQLHTSVPVLPIQSH